MDPTALEDRAARLETEHAQRVRHWPQPLGHGSVSPTDTAVHRDERSAGGLRAPGRPRVPTALRSCISSGQRTCGRFPRTTPCCAVQRRPSTGRPPAGPTLGPSGRHNKRLGCKQCGLRTVRRTGCCKPTSHQGTPTPTSPAGNSTCDGSRYVVPFLRAWEALATDTGSRRRAPNPPGRRPTKVSRRLSGGAALSLIIYSSRARSAPTSWIVFPVASFHRKQEKSNSPAKPMGCFLR